MAERIEFKETGERPEEQPEDHQEETNVDDEWRDDSIIIIDGSNPDAVRGNQEAMKDADRELGKRIGTIKKGYTEDKKSLLNEMGIRINKQDSPSLFERLKITVNGKGKINGAEFDKVKIIILKGKQLQCTEATDKSKVAKLNEFKELVKVAEERHSKPQRDMLKDK